MGISSLEEYLSNFPARPLYKRTMHCQITYNSVIGDRVFFIAIVISQVYSIIVHEIPKIFGRYVIFFLLQCALPRPEVIFEQHFLPISLALFNFSSSSLNCLTVANHRELSSHIPDWSAAGLSSGLIQEPRGSHWSHIHRNKVCGLTLSCKNSNN